MAGETILIVEDEIIVAKDLQNILKTNEYNVPYIAHNGTDAIKKTEEIKPDLILMDIMLKGKPDGIETAEHIRKKKNIPIIYLTAFKDDKTIKRALHTEPYGYLLKPFAERELHITIEMALYKHKIEEKLKESEDRYRNLVELSHDGIYILTDEKIQFFNKGGMTLLGAARPDELHDEEIFRFVHPDYINGMKERLGNLRHNQSDSPIEYKFVRLDGKSVMVECSCSYIYYKNNFSTMLVARDITERKTAEEALLAEREKLSVTMASISDGVITVDTEGRIILYNQAAEIITEWKEKEVLLQPVTRIFSETGNNAEEPLNHVLKGENKDHLERNIIFITKSGKEIVLQESISAIRGKTGNIIGAVLVFRDITIKKKMEEEVVKVQKLESLGVLAGGIAHDFNNILTAILGNITLSRLKSEDEEINGLLDDAEKACWRAKELTQQLLTFSKGGIPVKRIHDIKEIIKTNAAFSLHGSNINSAFHFNDVPVYIDMDAGQMNQVIQNLIINAGQAMPAGGIIDIYVDIVELNEKDKLNSKTDSVNLKPGQYVKIAISDKGTGIEPVQLQKIFDPFFTTKKQGSGLGLAVAYSIIKKHGGYIDVFSRIHEGSIFYIYLPYINDIAPVQSSSVNEGLSHGKGKILVMDDEASILVLMEKFLKKMGYESEFSDSGEQAILKYRESWNSKSPFDLVIMDLTIPGKMGGKEAAEELLRINPEAKIIISSGYSMDSILSNYREYGFSGVISKPFNLRDLSAEIYRVISI